MNAANQLKFLGITVDRLLHSGVHYRTPGHVLGRVQLSCAD